MGVKDSFFPVSMISVQIIVQMGYCATSLVNMPICQDVSIIKPFGKTFSNFCISLSKTSIFKGFSMKLDVSQNERTQPVVLASSQRFENAYWSVGLLMDNTLSC